MNKCIKCETAPIASHLSMHCEECLNTRFDMDYSGDNEEQVISMVISLDRLLEGRIERLQVLKDKMDKMADEHTDCSEVNEHWHEVTSEATQIYYEISPYIKSVIANYKVAKTVAQFGEVLEEMDNCHDCEGH